MTLESLRPLWHAKTVDAVLSDLRSRLAGLTSAELVVRRQQGGTNAIEIRSNRSALKLALAQFQSPLILILGLSAGLSFAFEAVTDGWIILAIVVFNAIVGFLQERRADRAMDRLQTLSPQRVRVIRDGDDREVTVDSVVVGDIVVLETGSVIPADGRVVEVVNLKVNEAVLTGESLPVEKTTDVFPLETPMAERRNVAYRSTTVVAGRGRLIVTDIGLETKFGGIVRQVAGIDRSPTPFQKQMAAFARRLATVVIALSAAVFALGVFRGFPLEQSILLGVSLVVSMIPEGLPVVITLTFALGMWQMAKRRALIRKLDAVETLGSVTVIASDKTGTLTFGEMMVEEIATDHRAVHVTGEGYRRSGDFFEGDHRISLVDDTVLRKLVEVGVLNNDSRLSRDEQGRERWIGDPTEICLTVLGDKVGFRTDELDVMYPRVGEFPFDFSLKYMVTFHRMADHQPKERYLVAVKGAPRQILTLCSRKLTPAGVAPLTETDREESRQQYERMAERSLRGLALAYAETDVDWRSISHETLGKHLIYLGLVGIRDPLRAEAAATVQACRQAGIRVIMMTGDYRVTAVSIARDLGILGRSDGDHLVLDGSTVDGMSDEQLMLRLQTVTVFSRVSPDQKLRIARLLKRNGEVVAMTGDGINDVPAIREANIGVAIGLGSTDAAKESADMVVTDGNLTSIVAAVEEGRAIFRNIQRVLIYLLASNLGGLLLILLALFLGFPLPLLPIHIIWLNAITDPFLGVALAREPKSPTAMSERPRSPHSPILSNGHWLRIALDGAAIGLGAFAVFVFASAREYSIGQVYAMTLTANAFGEWLTAFTTRSARRSAFWGIRQNPTMLTALLAVLVMQLAILYVPAFAAAFHLQPFGGLEWLVVILGGLPVVVVEEIRKAWRRRTMRGRS